MGDRVACLDFGKPALSSELYYYAITAEFVAAVGMIRKEIK